MSRVCRTPLGATHSNLNDEVMIGHRHRILRRASFNIQPQILEHELNDPQPWTESLRVQHDEDVLCLPYQTAPLYTEEDFESTSLMAHALGVKQLTVEFVSIFTLGSTRRELTA